MTERTKKILLAVVIGVLLVGVIAGGVLAAQAATRAQDYEYRLSATYQKSLAELVVNVGDIANSLKKTQVVAGERQYALLLSEIWRTAGEAASNLGQLPAGMDNAAKTSTFLTQTSDFAYSLLQKVTASIPVTAADMEQLYNLSVAADSLSAELLTLQQNSEDLYSDLLNFDYYSAFDSADGAEGGSGADPTPVGDAGGMDSSAEQSGEQSAGKYPTLIYDGPFSDSTSKAQPQGLGSGEYDEAAARQKATECLAGILSGELTYNGMQSGRIVAHSFSGATADGRTIDIEITQTGGHCLSMRVSGGTSDAPRPDDARSQELADIGQAYLNAIGYASMESTYAQYYGGTAVINYACVQDGALLYADLVKVWVDIQTGQVVGVEATNYLMSHVTRTIPTAQITEEQARTVLSLAVEVQSVRMAMIPMTLTDERYCYEFKCVFDGDYYIIYVNALTGMEEQIFRVIDSESGTLVV